MKKLIVFASLIGLVVAGLTPASAHVGTQMRGNTLQAGQSSRVYLSLGHGCTYKEAKYGTSVFPWLFLRQQENLPLNMYQDSRW